MVKIQTYFSMFTSIAMGMCLYLLPFANTICILRTLSMTPVMASLCKHELNNYIITLHLFSHFRFHFLYNRRYSGFYNSFRFCYWSCSIILSYGRLNHWNLSYKLHKDRQTHTNIYACVCLSVCLCLCDNHTYGFLLISDTYFAINFEIAHLSNRKCYAFFVKHIKAYGNINRDILFSSVIYCVRNHGIYIGFQSYSCLP